MPDLGERGYVMGPQPIAKVKVAPPAMLEAAATLLNALIWCDKGAVLAMTNPDMADEMGRIASAIKPGTYAKFELIGQARVSNHYFIKARLVGDGATPFTIQFRLGLDGERWTVREAMNLTGRRSAWTR